MSAAKVNMSAWYSHMRNMSAEHSCDEVGLLESSFGRHAEPWLCAGACRPLRRARSWVLPAAGRLPDIGGTEGGSCLAAPGGHKPARASTAWARSPRRAAVSSSVLMRAGSHRIALAAALAVCVAAPATALSATSGRSLRTSGVRGAAAAVKRAHHRRSAGGHHGSSARRRRSGARRDGADGVGVRFAGRLGRILDDLANGRTVYMFMADRHGASTCYGACERLWPPLRAVGARHARGGARLSRLGTIRRRHGGRQLTYAGHPLYLFAGDSRPGQVNGEGLRSFGARWYVVSVAGRPVRR